MAKDYWKQVVRDYAEAFGKELTEEEVEKMAESLLNNDHLWSDIESHLFETIGVK